MRIDIHIHADPQLDCVLESLKILHHSVHQLKELSIMNNADLVAGLTALNATVDSIATGVDHIGTETSALLQEVADLKLAVEAGGAISPEVEAALAAVTDRATGLAAKVQSVDDLVPDAPTPTV